MQILIEEAGQFIETALATGDQLVIGLVRRNQFWFRRPSGLLSRALYVRLQSDKEAVRHLPPSPRNSEVNFLDWVEKQEQDALVLIDANYQGLLGLGVIRWEEVDGLFRPAPGRMLFRAIALPARAVVSGRSFR